MRSCKAGPSWAPKLAERRWLGPASLPGLKPRPTSAIVGRVQEDPPYNHRGPKGDGGGGGGGGAAPRPPGGCPPRAPNGCAPVGCPPRPPAAPPRAPPP